jgi:hypothetical protein
MLPRWVIICAIVLFLVWAYNDPAGVGDFFNGGADSVGTFFDHLGDK